MHEDIVSSLSSHVRHVISLVGDPLPKSDAFFDIQRYFRTLNSTAPLPGLLVTIAPSICSSGSSGNVLR